MFYFQEYSVQITFRQQWNDNRLAFNDMNGKGTFINDVTPQFYPSPFCQTLKPYQRSIRILSFPDNQKIIKNDKYIDRVPFFQV